MSHGIFGIPNTFRREFRYSGIVRVEVLPKDCDDNARYDDGQKINRAKKSPEHSLAVQQQRKSQRHHNLQWDMDKKKDECVEHRPEKLRVRRQSLKIFHADPFHRCNDIPSMEDQDKRKHERVSDEQEEENDVRQNEPIAVPLAFSNRFEYFYSLFH